MGKDFVLFKSMSNEETFKLFKQLLKKQGIPYEVERAPDNNAYANVYTEGINNQHLFPVTSVYLRPADFEQAEELLLQISERETETVDPDYYLFEFDDSELMDVIAKPEEWSEHDYVLAHKILKQRGQDWQPAQLKQIKQKRLEELKKPTDAGIWIPLGYIFALMGGLIGVAIGWHLSKSKKVLPNGETHYIHGEKDRRSGRNILFISIAMIVVWAVVSLVRNVMD